MCGRFTQKSERKIISIEFFVDDFRSDVFINYNVSPGQDAGVILYDSGYCYDRYRWGLIPSWAKSGVASAYEVYCRVLSTGKSITYLAAPVEIILSYNVRRNVVTGTDVRANEVLLRLSNFRWDGTGWIRLPGAIDVSNQTIQSYINHLSYFGVCDIRLQQEPGFPYYGAEPNPFTPNNDGYNDVTYFKFPLAEEQGELTIFDINAAIVYKKTILPGQSWITWDGHYNQEGAGRTDLARAGIYIWQIKIGARIENGVVILAK